MTVASPHLLASLVGLREALLGVRLPLEVPGSAEARTEQAQMLGQLDDYVLPRLSRLEAPLLTVVGGSTGAGKSTLVNSLVGRRVSEPGVLRPTTRSPVLAHNPADTDWFDDDRILPELARTPAVSTDPRSLQLVPVDSVPAGLAVLDAPDIDSVEARNRSLATQLLAAADLWLFVTTASRYADQVPWDFLREAADRSAAVAIVLDRIPPGATDEVAGHLAEMLRDRGLEGAPLFTVEERPVGEDGLLPADQIAPMRDWLVGLAVDANARAAVVRQTLEGAIRALGRRAEAVALAQDAQAEAASRLRQDVEKAYAAARADVSEASADGTLLRGEVLARWQEFVGTGELLRSLETRVGWFRDRVGGWLRGKPQQVEQVAVAVESGLEALLVEHAEAAAERVWRAWSSVEAGKRLLDVPRSDEERGRSEAGRDLARGSRDLRQRAERTVREWQRAVFEMVRAEGADRRRTARFLAFGFNGLSVALMIVVFAHTAGVTGAEVGIAGGSAVLGQKLLEAVFGDQAVRRLADNARKDLEARVDALYAEEAARYVSVLAELDVDPGTGARLRGQARVVASVVDSV